VFRYIFLSGKLPVHATFDILVHPDYITCQGLQVTLFISQHGPYRGDVQFGLFWLDIILSSMKGTGLFTDNTEQRVLSLVLLVGFVCLKRAFHLTHMPDHG